MKILVVDDDVVARKVLSAFLKQSNYEMLIVEDANSAFRALTAPDAPPVAIIDWVMPDLTGPELCAKVRRHDFTVQPYLLILSGRKEKADIASALDAGADDFVSKPFNIQELQARLRVAVRTIERQAALRQQVIELQEQLLDARNSSAAESRSTEDALALPIASVPPAIEQRPVGVAALENHQIETVIAGALRHSGQDHPPRRVATAPRGTQVVAWAGILLTKEQLWVDLFLEMEKSNLATLMTQSRGSRNSGATGNTEDFCVKLHTALRDSMRSVLRAMGSDVQAPLAPQALSAADAADVPFPEETIHRHHYKVGAATLTFAFINQPCPLRAKTTEQLQLLDILAQPYPPADTHHVPLLRGGVVLKEQFIEKLQTFTTATSVEVPPVLVHSPSALALHYRKRAAAGR